MEEGAEESRSLVNKPSNPSLDPLKCLFDQVILVVLSYLKARDTRSFSHASKAHRDFIVKLGMLHYDLQWNYSFLYYQRIMDDGSFNVHVEVKKRGGHVVKLTLRNRILDDVSHLGKVKELNLSCCRGITRGWDSLGELHDLNLSEYIYLFD